MCAFCKFGFSFDLAILMVLVFLNCLVVPKRSFLSEFGVDVPARQMATAEPTAQAAAHAAEAQAALEAVGEVARLLALERREVAATGVLRGVLDARYMMLRPVLTRVVCGAALRYEGGWAAAELCMALLDAWRAAVLKKAEGGAAAGQAGAAGGSGGSGGSELAPELAAAGLLAAAVGFVRDPASARPGDNSLTLLAERWAFQVVQLSARRKARLETRPAVFEALSAGLSLSNVRAAAAIRAAQASALVTLDWRVRRTTAREVLQAIVRVAAQDIEVEEDALEFCSLGLLRGASLFYGPSVLAAASLRAARSVHGLTPAWPDQLALFVPMLPGGGAEAEHCMRDLLHMLGRRRVAKRVREPPEATGPDGC